MEQACLDEDELNKVINKNLSVERLNLVRDLFVFSCFTGLAYADLKKLSGENLYIGTTSIPYEYIDGFWNYCGNADGKVFLNLTNIEESFKSRKTYLTERIIKTSIVPFLIAYIIIIGFLFYNFRKKKNSLNISLQSP